MEGYNMDLSHYSVPFLLYTLRNEVRNCISNLECSPHDLNSLDLFHLH